jgi:o-succinylbenzoate synthase
MKIKTFSLHFHDISLTNGQIRSGILINITDEKGNGGWGEIAPLPKWSHETLEDSLKQFNQKQQEIMRVDWTAPTCLREIEKLNLLPSVSFGLESALLSMLSPIPEHSVPTSALFMGSPQEIMQQAELRHGEGYTSAKLKVSNLSFEEAAQMIHQLKNKFRLRIDVNRAWRTSDSLQFFEQFPLDTFDYVEEPFQNPDDLALFPHPLGVDESFPHDLCLEQLESLPTLKALIYKPTIQGGMLGCLPLHEWTAKRGIELVLSSSFESDLGLAYVASIAHRLSLSAPVGIGTYYYLNDFICAPSLQFSDSFVHIPAQLKPKVDIPLLLQNSIKRLLV